MRKLIMALATGICLLVQSVGYGQINAAEYFYDTDPGVGNGTSITVTTADSVDVTTSFPTTGLGAGFHNLYIRTRNTNNRWSLYAVRNFYLSTPPSGSSPQIVAAEYFIDVDPGIGNGTPISTGAIADSVDITTNIPTAGLSVGFHNLHIRTRNTDNRWSLYAPRNFYVSGAPILSSPQIVAAEYFIDADPGIGNGTAVSTGAIADSVDITTSISTSGLSAGFHNLHIRAKNTAGLWSLYAPRNFYVQPTVVAANLKIVAAEYFIDADPGVGNGTAISPSFTAADSIDIIRSVSSAGLTAGPHWLLIRTKNQDGLWSHAVSDSFNICTPPSAGSISGAGAVCVGASATLTNSVPSGTWSSVNGRASITSAGIVSGVTAGIDTIRYGVSNTCGTAFAEKVVTVNATPGPVTTSTVVCTGTITTLINSLPGGTWTSGNPTVASVVAATGVLTGGSTAGTATITYTMLTGCSATGVVTVVAGPAVIGGALSACVGNAVTLTNATPGGSWSSSTTSVATIGSASGALSGVAVGTTIVSYTLPSGCMRTAIVTVNAVPAAIGGSLGLCAGSTTTLTNTTTGGTWTSGNPTIASIVSATGVLTGGSAGTATVTYTLSTGCTATAVVTVAVTPSPIGGVLSVCEGNTVTLTNTTPGGSWTSGTTSVAAIGSASGLLSGVSGGTAIVSYAISGCIRTAIVTVNNTPAPIGGSLGLCAGSTTTLTNTTTGGTWISGNPTVASIVSATGVLTGGIAGTATITYALPTGCRATAIVSVGVTPAAIGGVFSVCVGNSVTLTNATLGGTWSSGTTSVAAIGSASGVLSGVSAGTTIVSYAISGCIRTAIVTVNTTPAAIGGSLGLCAGSATTLTNTTTGGTWISGNPTVASIVPATGILTGGSAGTATITYTLSTGCTATAVVTVSVTPAPIGGVFSGCVGSAMTLTNATPGGSWSSSTPSVAVIGSASGVLTGVGTGTTIVSYTMPSGCMSTDMVTVNATPAPIGGSLGLCAGSTTTLTNTTLGGIWHSGNLTVASIGLTTGVLTGGSAGTATITYTVPTGCRATAVVTVGITPAVIGGAFSVCEGSTVTLTNATPGGSWSSGTTSVAVIGSASGVLSGVSAGTTIVSYAISGCSRTAIVTVNATPAAIGGSLGLCAGSTTTLTNTTTGGTWTSGNPTVASIVSATGVLTGGSPGTATITYALPGGCSATTVVSVGITPAAIGGVLSVCVGNAVTLTNATSGGSWSSGATSVAAIGSASGVLSGVSAGTTIVSYAISGCSRTAIVTVNNTPASIGGSLGLCAGSATTLTNATTGGAWTSGNPTVASIVSATGVLTGSSAGTATITYALPTGCSATAIVSVGVTPAAIGGVFSVCEGNSVTLTNATSGGSWSSGTTSVAEIGSASGVVTGVGAGTTIVSYAISGCVRTAIVTVNAVPASIGGSLGLCAGSTTTLTNTTTGGTWTSTTPAIGSISTAGVVTGSTAGTTTVSYTIPSGCFRTAIVTVNPLPAVIAGLSTVCEGSTRTLTSGTTGGTWTSSDAGTASIGSATGIVSGIAAGTATITYSLSTGCIRTGSFTVDPLPAAITGTASVCVGSSATLSSATVGGSWSSSSTAIATVGTSGVFSGVAAGTAVISYTSASGCTATKAVTVNALPSTISGAASVCVGSVRTLSSGPAGGTWSSSAPAVGGIGAASGIVDGISVGTTQITYQLLTGCQQTITLTVNPLPAAVSGTAAVCAGSTTSLSSATTGGVWSSSSIITATVGGASGVVTGVAAGTTTISYTLASGCSVTSVVTVDAVPSTIIGSSTVCAGSSVTLSNSISGGTWSSGSVSIATIGALTGIVSGISAGTTQIMYQLPTGCAQTITFTVNPLPAAISGTAEVCVGSATSLSNATAGGTWSSSSIATATVGGASGVVAGVAAGTATISYTLTGCSTTSVVTVHGVPAAITGSSTACTGSTVTLSNITFGGTWSSSAGSIATINAATGIVDGISAGAAQITYQLPTGCQRIITFTVNPLPAAISGTAEVCVGSATSLSSATTGGAWSSSGTSTATVGGASGVVSGVAAGTATISYTLAGCNTTSVVTVHAAPATIVGSSTVCAGATVTLSNATSGGTWSSGAGSIATIDATTGIVDGISAGSTQMTYQLSTGCQQTITFTVNPLPAAISGTAEVCAGSATSLSNTTPGGVWSSSGTSTATVGGASGAVTGVAAGTASITYMLATGCNTTSVVTVHAAPAAITGSPSVCAGTTVTLSNATSGGTWSSDVASIATIGAATGILSGVAVGTSLVSYTLATGCAATLVVSVNPLPFAGSVSGVDTVCAQETSPLANTAPGGTWSSSDPSVATVSSEGSVTGVGAGSAIISYTVANSCGTVAAMHLLIVKPTAECVTNVKNAGANAGIFRLYPNPAYGAFSIETSVAGKMSIYTLDGKEIGTYTLKAAVNSLALPKGTASGVYMCRFTGSDGSTQVIRLIYEP